MEDLLYIGPATGKKPRRIAVSTIGRLAESVAFRMRELASRCTVVEVCVRDKNLVSFTRMSAAVIKCHISLSKGPIWTPKQSRGIADIFLKDY